MKKILFVLFLLSVSAIYAQRTIDLPIATAIDTVDRFTTLYRPSAATTLRQVTFKTVRDYFWTRINHWKNSNTWIDTVGVTTNLINVLLVKGDAGADANVTAGKYITHVTNNDNTTAIGLYAKAMGGTTNYAAYFDSGSVFVKKGLFVADSTFKVSTTGNIKKWRNKSIDDIPLTDSTKVLYSNGKWKIPVATADTTINYHWMGLHNFEQDSIKIGGLWYDFPATRIANSVLYDSLGNGILKWKVYPTGGTTIDTTKISYLAKAETFTGAKTFNGDLIFGASADLTLPTADPTPNVGKLWRSTDVLKYTNSAGDAKTLTFGTGTINELAYWSSANSLGTLPVATYPSLTELSYVKGLSSAIQTQLTGKLTTGLTSANIFVGNGSNIATGVAMSGDATISNLGAVTVADDSHVHTGTTISGLAVADFTSPNISNWTNDAAYATQTYVTNGGYTWNNTVALNTAVLFDASLGYLKLPSAGGTNSNAFYYDGEVRLQTFPGNFALIRDNGSYSNPAWITALAESKISFTDITTGNASTSNHGYLLKLNNSATQFMNGQGAWATPDATIPPATNTADNIPLWNGANSKTLKDGLAFTSDSTASTIVGRNGSKSFSARDLTLSNSLYSRSATIGDVLVTGGTMAINRDGNITNWGLYPFATNYANGESLVFRSATGFEWETLPQFATANTWTGVNEFQSDLKFTDDLINVWESESNLSTDNFSVAGKTSIKLTTDGNDRNVLVLSDGVDGKIVTIMSDDASFDITFVEDAYSGSFYFGGATTYIKLDDRYDTVTFKYVSSVSRWVCVGGFGYTNN